MLLTLLDLRIDWVPVLAWRRHVVDPATGGAYIRRARALRDMPHEAPREHDVGFERDADDLLVVGRGDVEAGELGLGLVDRGGLAAAVVGLGGGGSSGDAEPKRGETRRAHPSPR